MGDEPMLFEGHPELTGGYRSESVSRLSEGLLQGHRDTWVVVAREGVDLADWLGPDPEEPAGPALRICREVLADGTLVLEKHNVLAAHPYAGLLDFE